MKINKQRSTLGVVFLPPNGFQNKGPYWHRPQRGSKDRINIPAQAGFQGVT